MFTGAEIEEVVKEGMFMAFHEGRELAALRLLTAIVQRVHWHGRCTRNGAIRQSS